jgi:dimethylamine/trimethylamine dehydrogenase
MVLGKRGMQHVHIVDRSDAMGGHLRWVTRLPGLATWSRVTHYREGQIGKLNNVRFVPRTHVGLEDVLEYGAEIVIIATGSRWDPTGMSAPTHVPVAGASGDAEFILTPEQLVLDGKSAGERAVVYDTDGYFMGVTMAEQLAEAGRAVTYITHFDSAAPYMRFTLEEQRQYQRLVELGVEIVTQTLVVGAGPGSVSLVHVWSGAESELEADTLMLVTQRESDSALYDELRSDQDRLAEADIGAVFAIGDAWAPGMVAQAVFSGHRLAREIDSPDPNVPLPFIRERRVVGNGDGEYGLDSRTIAAPPG